MGRLKKTEIKIAYLAGLALGFGLGAAVTLIFLVVL